MSPSAVPEEILRLLGRPEFPRSARYDADWMMDNQMGTQAANLYDPALGLRAGVDA